MRVVVVGAGLGGLCVANALRRTGADIEVLEAHDGITDAAQGYRININATGHDALHACLAAKQFEDYERSLHRQDDPATYLFSPALQLLSRDEMPPVPGAVDRGALRRVLAEGVADRITFGREVTSLADVGDADLVVAADGIGSALRRELLPHAGPEPLGWTAIFGRSPLTAVNRPWMPPVVMRSRFCGVTDQAATLALCAYDPPVSTTIAPYVMWVLMGRDEELPRHGTSRADLVHFAQDRTADWDARATSVLRDSIIADTFMTPLRAMPAIPDIPTATGIPVAFLGDTIHAMSPAGGEGANTALGDAARLMSHVDRTGDLTEAVAAYHRDMRITAGAALARSAGFAVEAHHVAGKASHV
ncbi:FAD-dependent oxidoreductase [Nonomuraea helvata]|uniref:FAD-dependent oxidoreductase n=1 Tax=Nonomuraea helvata TaxID=37484 RepID=A0ABV5S5J8_9ACTN